MLMMWCCDASARSRFATKGENFELKRRSFFERKSLEQGAPGRGQVMLHRIAQREERAAGALQSIAQRDQFLPTVDADPPAVASNRREFFGFDVEIGHVGIAPDERMKRLDVAAVDPSFSRR